MLSDKTRHELNIIVKKFLSGCSLKSINIDEIPLDRFDWDFQELLLKRTINNPLVIKYPLKISYQTQFLKKFIDLFEKNGIEVHDELYLGYCRLLDETDGVCHKHYEVDRIVVSLKESGSFVSEGTTGLCSWQASLALSEWCVLNKDLIVDKKVLELGCGVGLVGVTLARICQPRSITLTDCHQTVLKTLCHNLDVNLTPNECDQNGAVFVNSDNRDGSDISDIREHSAERSESGQKSGNGLESRSELRSGPSDRPPDNLLSSFIYNHTKIEVLNLNWEDTGTVYSGDSPDLLLGADIVYDSTIFNPLSQTLLHYFLSNPKTTAIFACTERNKHTLEGFLNVLESKRLAATEIPSAPQKHFYWNQEIPIRFFRISLA